MSILNDVLDYVEANATLMASIKTQEFVGTPDADPVDEIMARTIPGTVFDETYLDRSSMGTFNIAFYAKSTTPSKPEAQLDLILAVLRLPEETVLTELCKVKIMPVSSPLFVRKTEQNEYIFTASVGVEYFTKEG